MPSTTDTGTLSPLLANLATGVALLREDVAHLDLRPLFQAIRKVSVEHSEVGATLHNPSDIGIFALIRFRRWQRKRGLDPLREIFADLFSQSGGYLEPLSAAQDIQVAVHTGFKCQAVVELQARVVRFNRPLPGFVMAHESRRGWATVPEG